MKTQVIRPFVPSMIGTVRMVNGAFGEVPEGQRIGKDSVNVLLQKGELVVNKANVPKALKALQKGGIVIPGLANPLKDAYAFQQGGIVVPGVEEAIRKMYGLQRGGIVKKRKIKQKQKQKQRQSQKVIVNIGQGFSKKKSAPRHVSRPTTTQATNFATAPVIMHQHYGDAPQVNDLLRDAVKEAALRREADMNAIGKKPEMVSKGTGDDTPNPLFIPSQTPQALRAAPRKYIGEASRRDISFDLNALDLAAPIRRDSYVRPPMHTPLISSPSFPNRNLPSPEPAAEVRSRGRPLGSGNFSGKSAPEQRRILLSAGINPANNKKLRLVQWLNRISTPQ